MIVAPDRLGFRRDSRVIRVPGKDEMLDVVEINTPYTCAAGVELRANFKTSMSKN